MQVKFNIWYNCQVQEHQPEAFIAFSTMTAASILFISCSMFSRPFVASLVLCVAYHSLNRAIQGSCCWAQPLMSSLLYCSRLASSRQSASDLGFINLVRSRDHLGALVIVYKYISTALIWTICLGLCYRQNKQFSKNVLSIFMNNYND